MHCTTRSLPCSVFPVALILGLGTWSAPSAPMQAQLIPDTTLGLEASVVTSGNWDGVAIDRIEGGATRGANLFHSFEQFNVDEAQRVYFGNPDGVVRGSVRLENDAVVDGALAGGGDIQVTARTIDILSSVVQTGIREGFGTVESQAGDIRLAATDYINIVGERDFGELIGVSNTIEPNATGNAGTITIQTPVLEIRNRGQIVASTLGEGNAGNIQIAASDRILIDADEPTLGRDTVTGILSEQWTI